MRQISISLRTSARNAELDFDDPETARLLIEVCASRALIELLGSVIVDSVEISGDDMPVSEEDAPTWPPL